MATPDERTRELVRGLWRDASGPGVTPSQAKLYSNHVRLGLRQPGLGSFSSGEAASHLREAELLLESASLQWDGRPDGEWRRAIKRSGELLEWLAHDEIQTNGIPATILAAAAYQLAGFPALALGLLGHGSDDESVDADLTRRFLAADFPRLLQESHAALVAVTNVEADESSEARVDRLIMTEIARSMGVLSGFMRWGDDPRLPMAIEKLRAVARLARHSQVRYSAITARIFALVADEYAKGNVWPHLQALGANSTADGRRAFLRFGRAAFLKRRSLAWPSQVAGIERLRTGASFVLCTPTGSGKTTVAELALVGDLLGRPPSADTEEAAGASGDLALYLVPSRALASEVEGRLASDLGALDGRVVVTGLYGGTDWGPTDAWLTADAPTILVCTYEKAEALLRFLGPIFMRRVRTVVVDEAHTVQFDDRPDSFVSLRTSENRALRLEILAVRLLRALDGCPYRLIALSAVTAGLEVSLARWLVGRADAEPARSDYRSTRQLIGRLECVAGGTSTIFYDLLDRAPLTFDSAGDGPYVPNPFPRCPPSASFDGKGTPSTWLRPFVAWAAFQLAKPDADGRAHSVLVSITSHIEWYTTSFLKLLEEDWQAVELPVFYEAPTEIEDIRLWDDCVATLRDYFTVDSPEYRLLQRGIAVHHGKMPAPLARRLKAVIERGLVRVVVATSTLSEGVNLPVEYVLVPDVHRGKDALKPQEFLNLVGRAGRPGHGTEGRTLVLLPKASGRRDYNARRLIDGYWRMLGAVRQDRQSPPNVPDSPLARLLTLLRQEWTKLTGSNDDDAFERWLESQQIEQERPEDEPRPAVQCLDTLDGILVAAIEELEQLRANAEAPSAAELESALREIWDRTFAKIAANSVEKLERTFLKRGLAIPAIYADRAERRRIYKTSLPPASARGLLARVGPISTHLKSGVTYATMSRDEQYLYVEQTIELIAAMPRFAPSKKVGNAKVDWKVVLRWWLDRSGATKEPKAETIGAWHEYANKNFTYKAAWALGSVISLCLDNDGASGLPIALSLEDWPKSGLPWAAFWIKELLTWGTLDPVVAFLMARGLVVTRDEGEERATAYYADQSNPDSNAWLDPKTIRNWAGGAGFAVGSRAPASDPWRAEVPVRLESRQGWETSQLRVLPAKRAGDHFIDWFDTAGYLVATCDESLLDATWHAEHTDFMLDVARKTIVVTPYL